MSMKKTIYLHIGEPKTGTSALQYFFLKNRDILRQNGIAYPTHRLESNRISSGNADVIAQAEKNLPKARAFLSEIMKISCPAVLLSNENLYLCDQLDTIGRLFKSVTVKVIVYWRRQDQLALSLYNQWVKRKRVTVGINEWISNKPEKRFSDELLLRWIRLFGKENVCLRIYENQQFAGGTLFTDFLNILGLPFTNDYQIPAAKINPSYRVDAIEIQRLFNTLPQQRGMGHLDRLLQDYSENTKDPGDWPYDLLSPREQRNIVEHYADINAGIARNCLGRADGRLFYDPLPAMDSDWQPYPGLSRDDVRRIASFIAQHDPKVSYQVSRAIRKGLESPDPAAQAAAQKLTEGLTFFLSRRVRLNDHFDYLKYRLSGPCRQTTEVNGNHQ